MLSFLTGGDVYDPDRVDADREQLRTYYRSKGYADASVPSARAEYDPATTRLYADLRDRRRPALSFRRHHHRLQCAGARSGKASPPAAGRSRARCSTAARWTRPTMCSPIELAKLGYPFAHATPRTTRDADGKAHRRRVHDRRRAPRTYVERIDIHGNTRTRGYVIRREFDIAEGDAYNKTLIDRAERRLKNLNYFKTVKITDEAGLGAGSRRARCRGGGAADRRFQHRRRLLDDRRLARRGQARRPQFLRHRRRACKSAFTYGQYAAASICRRPSRIFSATALSAGIDLFAKQTDCQPLPVLRQRHLWRDAC